MASSPPSSPSLSPLPLSQPSSPASRSSSSPTSSAAAWGCPVCSAFFSCSLLDHLLEAHGARECSLLFNESGRAVLEAVCPVPAINRTSASSSTTSSRRNTALLLHDDPSTIFILVIDTRLRGDGELQVSASLQTCSASFCSSPASHTRAAAAALGPPGVSPPPTPASCSVQDAFTASVPSESDDRGDTARKHATDTPSWPTVAAAGARAVSPPHRELHAADSGHVSLPAALTSISHNSPAAGAPGLSTALSGMSLESKPADSHMPRYSVKISALLPSGEPHPGLTWTLPSCSPAAYTVKHDRLISGNQGLVLLLSTHYEVFENCRKVTVQLLFERER